MTPAELNAIVKKYRGWIARWEGLIAEYGENEHLRNDIADLHSWIAFVMDGRQHLDFRTPAARHKLERL